MIAERALAIDCAGERLVAIVSEPLQPAPVGLLMVVGGPQYRVGSHRQFLLLARRLAEAGIAVMRFDYRGMGDSSGATQTFEHTVPDIEGAIGAFKSSCPSVERVVLWGLCDAASAILLYCHVTSDTQVAGIVLLNPWVRSEETLAVTHVKHYYAGRIFARQFWGNLVRGNVDLIGTLRAFTTTLKASISRHSLATDANAGFQDRMALAFASFSGPVLLVLSGRDLTAKEFREYCQLKSRWRGLLQRANVEHRDLPEADHTFSTAVWRQQVETLTLDWMKRSFGTGSR